MALTIFYSLNCLLLLSGLLVFSIPSHGRRFSLGIGQFVIALPLLGSEYLYLRYNLELAGVQLLFFSETVFVLVWVSMALSLSRAVNRAQAVSPFNYFIEYVIGIVIAAITFFLLAGDEVVGVFDQRLSFYLYNPLFFICVLVLVGMLFGAYRLEGFYSRLAGSQKREFTFYLLGCCLVGGTLIWSVSYRLTFLFLAPKHLLLLSVLLFVAWFLILYSVVHYRLFAKKTFISRKVAYSFIVPALLAVYLLGFGVVSIIMRHFGVEMADVFKWATLLGCIGIAALFTFSSRLRKRAHFFINTHFYASKYDYRDEWLALSTQLHGARSEVEVVRALRKVLADCLYASDIFIWLGDFARGYKLVAGSPKLMEDNRENIIPPYNKLVMYLAAHPYFYMEDQEPNAEWHEVVESGDNFLQPAGLSLVIPLSIGRRLVGFVAISSEFTGGRYGRDDFDLLTALCSQTASNVLAARIGEKFAQAREEQAWNRLSAFVLHDIKNAATMLSLLQENAQDHIHEPEFQQDMLELVDDALRRMARVEKQLGSLHQDVIPEMKHIELNSVLAECVERLQYKLDTLKVINRCYGEFHIRCDLNLLHSIVENIILNAFEAGGKSTVIDLETKTEGGRRVVIKIADNGPGIARELLPDALFQPFKTSKEGGTGIGLWQVKRLVATLEGSIEAGNNPEGGAYFLLKFPLAQKVGA